MFFLRNFAARSYGLFRIDTAEAAAAAGWGLFGFGAVERPQKAPSPATAAPHWLLVTAETRPTNREGAAARWELFRFGPIPGPEKAPSGLAHRRDVREKEVT